MSYKVGNGADLDVPLAGEADTAFARHHLGAGQNSLAGHFLGIINDFANGSDGLFAGKTAEFRSGLGVAVAGADAAGDGAQREDVARTAQVGGCGLWVGEGAAGEGAIVCADAGGGEGVFGVDGDGVGGAARVLGVGDHGRKVEGSGAVGGHGHADVARGVTDHPTHLFGSDVLSGDNQVALVFAARVVEDEEEFAIACAAGKVSTEVG